MRPELKGRPVVLYTATRAGATTRRGDWQVAQCSRTAVAAGVRPGMPLAEAQSLLERSRNASFVPHDPAADRKLLESVAGWCARYSPLVGLEPADEPSSLFLDVTGCSHLFAGEERMAEQIARDFERVGYRARVALADTPGAGWAVTHFGWPAPAERPPVRRTGDRPHRVPRDEKPPRGGTRRMSPTTTAVILPAGEQAAVLAPLPVAALRLSPNLLDTLYELGIRQIGQLQQLPRSSLPARFGTTILERLDQALGRLDELIVPAPPLEPIEACWSFEEPTADRQALAIVLRRLLEEVASTLTTRQEGALRLACRLLCLGTEAVCLQIGVVHPTAVAEHLCELAQLQLERLTLIGEVLGVEVEVLATGPLETHQPELFDSGVPREGERQLAVLLDRLSSRLGEKAVLRPRLRPDPQPEYASRLVTALSHPPHSGPPAVPEISDYRFISGPAVRPLRLKPQPVPIEVISVVPQGPPIRFRLLAATGRPAMSRPRTGGQTAGYTLAAGREHAEVCSVQR
ncbi:MAG: DNA polymerase Y family protein, partial [Planctomycetes bacterium]|nr:DNA polymerase Y family protein [Planctomycetota bacterium]